MKTLVGVVLLLASVMIFSDVALARDLASVATAAQAQFTKIGVASLGIGFTIGGLLFVLGMAQIGRTVLISAAIGAVAILGGPAVITLLTRIFGV